MTLQAAMEDHYRNSRRNRVGLTTDHEEIMSLVTEWVFDIEATKKRAFSDTQRQTCFDMLLGLSLDLISAANSVPPVWIGYSRGKANYIQGGAYWDHQNSCPMISQTFYFQAIEYLEERGFLLSHVAQAGHSTFSSRMTATPALVEEFASRGFNWTHVLEKPDADCVVVKDENKRPTTWPNPDGFALDSALANLARINSALAHVHINLKVPDAEIESLNSSTNTTPDNDESDEDTRSKVDFTNRKVRRIFSQSSFHVGGRFYGGWWQSVPSASRKYIELNGWPTVELDYSTMQPRILYTWVGREAPADSYVLDGWGSDLRKIVKKAFSQLLNSDQTSRNPNQWHRFAPDMKPDPLPSGWSDLSEHQQNGLRRDQFLNVHGRPYGELIADLLAFHEPIGEYFFSGIWGKTQSTDAQIAELVMIKLLDRKKPEIVLPIHDSFIVRIGREDLLFETMQEAFRDVVGADALIDQDKTILDLPDGYEGREAEYLEELLESVTPQGNEYSGYRSRNEEWSQTFGSIDGTMDNQEILYEGVEAVTIKEIDSQIVEGADIQS